MANLKGFQGPSSELLQALLGSIRLGDWGCGSLGIFRIPSLQLAERVQRLHTLCKGFYNRLAAAFQDCLQCHRAHDPLHEKSSINHSIAEINPDPPMALNPSRDWIAFTANVKRRAWSARPDANPRVITKALKGVNAQV
jgi:hypothetical protein